MTHRILFTGHVSEDGYRWIESHPAPAADDRRELFLTAGKRPGAHSVRARTYDPLEEYTGLFRVFAETELSRESILAFAGRFGSLGGSLTTPITLYDRPVGTGFAGGRGEPFRGWTKEITALRCADRLWEAARRGDEQDLLEMIVWAEDRSAVSFDTHPHLKPAERMQLREPSTVSLIATEGDGLLERFVSGDVVQPALFYVQQVVNRHLRGRVSPRLLWDEQWARLNLCLVPEGLIGALWLQFARAVENDNEFRRCAECGLWFELTPGTARSDKRYCTNACRTRAYRRRQAEAVRLHDEGRAVEEIAAELEAETDAVRAWVEKGRTRPPAPRPRGRPRKM